MHLTEDTTAHVLKLRFLWGENAVQNMVIRNALRGIKCLLHYQKIHTV